MKERFESLQNWLISENIDHDDLLSVIFPIEGGRNNIIEASDLLCDRIRSKIGVYPKELKMRVGGKRTKPLSIEVLCDWAERAQPTTTQLQRRRV